MVSKPPQRLIIRQKREEENEVEMDRGRVWTPRIILCALLVEINPILYYYSSPIVVYIPLGNPGFNSNSVHWRKRIFLLGTGGPDDIVMFSRT